ncbi:hypothetical protein PTKIN_Ptkin13bG0193600 [Pterospermum kingtungense]
MQLQSMSLGKDWTFRFAFNPLRISVGGSLQDQVVYNIGRVKNCPCFKKRENGLFGFSKGCLPMKRWDELDNMFQQTRNEFCGGGVGARVEAEQYGKNVIALKNLVKELHPDLKTQPKVLGPGGFYDEKWFITFLEVSGRDVVDRITHHIYNLGSGNFVLIIKDVDVLVDLLPHLIDYFPVPDKGKRMSQAG